MWKKLFLNDDCQWNGKGKQKARVAKATQMYDEKQAVQHSYMKKSGKSRTSNIKKSRKAEGKSRTKVGIKQYIYALRNLWHFLICRRLRFVEFFNFAAIATF